jgi:hypothetical protein
MIKQVTVLDVQDPHPQDVSNELRQIWNNKNEADGASNGSYEEFHEDYWDDYTALPKYLAEAGLVPGDLIIILIWW